MSGGNHGNAELDVILVERPGGGRSPRTALLMMPGLSGNIGRHYLPRCRRRTSGAGGSRSGRGSPCSGPRAAPPVRVSASGAGKGPGEVSAHLDPVLLFISSLRRQGPVQSPLPVRTGTCTENTGSVLLNADMCPVCHVHEKTKAERVLGPSTQTRDPEWPGLPALGFVLWLETWTEGPSNRW